MNLLSILDSSFLQGLSWGLATLGLIISLRIFRFPDLTVDGSFGLGGAISAILLANGYSPLVATFFSFIGGLLAGFLTGILHIKAKIGKLLSGILMMTALYSINFRVMGNCSNIPLLDVETLISFYENRDIHFFLPQLNLHIATYAFYIVFWFFICVVFYFCYYSEWGLIARLAGYDENRSDAYGFDSGKYIVKGLMFSNGLVALSGSLVSQSQGFSDYNMGTGLVITALASILIGEQIVRFILPTSFTQEKMSPATLLIAPFIGTFMYYFLVGLLLRMSSMNMLPIIRLQPTDLKLITAMSVVAIIWLLPIKHTSFPREETI